MRPRPSPPGNKRGTAAQVIGLSLACLVSSARADNAVVPDLPVETKTAAATASGALHLEVFINGHDVKVAAEVFRDADGVFSAKRSELVQSGLNPPAGLASEKVRFDTIPGLSYRYDEPSQSIYFEAPDSLLATHVYGPDKREPPSQKATSAYGAVLNYDAFASTAAWSRGHPIAFGGGSLTVDGRAFSPFGVLSSSAVFGTTITSPATALRLDTGYNYYDEDRLMTYRAGDFINSSLSWTRPIRMGGVQISHDYSMRPDLVTTPLPSVSGTAAVPSSVDVYLNNFKVFTQDVDPGPFRIESLPMVAGNGDATLVLHDINGAQTTQSVPFFSSARMLSPGLFDYSVEAGYARTNYGVDSFSYDPKLVGSASVKAGLNEWVTLEAHTEDGAGMINGGGGLVLNAFNRGVIEGAAAGSGFQGGRGLQVSVDAATAIGPATIDVSSQRTFGPYGDLAEITTPISGQNSASALLQQASTGGVFLSPLLLSTSLAPPKALDRITFGLPNVFDWASVNLSFVNEVQTNKQQSRIASVGLSRSFSNGAAVFATAYADLAHRRDAGVFVGFSWTFDNQITASSQGGMQNGQIAVNTQIGKSADQQVGSYGWRINDNEGANRFTEADASYLSPIGKASATVSQFGGASNTSALGSAEFTGSVAALGGAIKLAPVVPDAFTLVDAGAPGVDVLQDNRVIGKTDYWGQLLVPNLRGFEDNKIAIDPMTLPLSAQASITETEARPISRAGVVSDFKVVTEAHDAEVILTDEKGVPLPLGARVEHAGSPSAAVAYDGRVYLVGLAAHNLLTVHVAGKDCSAEFDYQSAKGATRPTIGPIKCVASKTDAAN
jgi:outer membrane usher protein